MPRKRKAEAVVVVKNKKPTFLQKVALFFYNKKETTIVFWLAILMFGIASYTTLMQRQGFPNIDIPISVVSGTYFAGDKKVVDEKIAKPIAESLLTLPEIKSVSTQTGDFFYSAIIEYKSDITSKQGNDLVELHLKSKNILPIGATQEFKAIDAGRFEEQSDMLLSIYKEAGTSVLDLQAAADVVSGELSTLGGVENSTILKQIKQGIDPATNQTKSETTRFDRIGMRDGSGAVVFYPSVIVGVRAKPGTDALKLYDEVTAKLQGLKTDPRITGTKVTVAADFAEGIRSQISGLQKSLLEGLVVVIVISCLLISLRAGLATALSMVTVLMGTIGLLYAFGVTLNTITLFGLILSLGLIVDDTTIMVEAIDASKGKEADKRLIVAQAVKRVAKASFAGTITTMLGFAPMLFIGGILGDFIRILPITIITALFMSLLVSLTLVPFLARLLLGKKRKQFNNPIHKIESYVANALAKTVVSGQKSKKKRILHGVVAIGFSTIMFASSLPLFGKLKFDIFPNTKDSDVISVALRFDDQTTITQAAALSDKANIIIGDTLGKNIARVSYQSTGSTSDATATIDLISYKKRDQKSPQFIELLQTAFEGFEGAQVKVSQLDAGPPKDDYPFTVRIASEDTTKATVLAHDMRDFLLNKQIKRLNGTTAQIVRTQSSRPSVVTRENGKSYVSVSAGFDATDISALTGPAEELVKDTYSDAALAPYGISKDSLSFDFGSESDNQDSFKSMLIAFPVLLLAMYLLLVFLFRSFLQPILIFMAIPFSFFGVAAGLYLTDNPLSFFVMVGFFALIGIAVNNTILLTDYANQVRGEGKDAYEAMSLAIKSRFRPLVATSLTSVVALIPLALTDPFWESLSFTLIFGLLSSTLLVIVAFPYYYLIGEWLRGVGKRMWQRQLARPLQIVADIIIAPIRVVRFLLWIIFAWRR